MRFTAHMAILSGKHRPNSFGAMRECFEAGAERIEIDIHSLDGADYAVYHDRRLEEHTTGSGSIGRATPEEIRNARFRDAPDDRVPLLSEVVALARDCAHGAAARPQGLAPADETCACTP